MKRGQKKRKKKKKKRTTSRQHVDVLLEKRETLQPVLRLPFYTFTFSPTSIYSSVNGTQPPQRHLRLRGLPVQQDMETIKVYLQSPAFMSCQLPLMGSSCKADRKVTALERKKKSAATGVAQEERRAFRRMIRAKY